MLLDTPDGRNTGLHTTHVRASQLHTRESALALARRTSRLSKSSSRMH